MEVISGLKLFERLGMGEVEFHQIPALVLEIGNRLDRIEKYLYGLKTTSSEEDVELLTISQAAELLTLAVSTLYGKVCRMEIPVNKKGKRLYFEKEVLLAWVRNGRRRP